jgi:transmembrane sensor
MLVIGAAMYWPNQFQPNTMLPLVAGARAPVAITFETRVGERSTFTLSDETIVTLNTDSLVSVHFADSSGVRRLKLERGQALFEVAKDGRPFEVYAGDRRVIALGTAFDIRLEPDSQGVLVTLVEGLVDVDVVPASVSDLGIPDSGLIEAVSPTRLKPGQQFIAKPKSQSVVIEADMERATGWREGRLVFRGDSLSRAVAEINRYSQRKLVVRDQEQLQSIRISGVFAAGSTRSFIEAIESIHPIKAYRVAYDRIELSWLSDDGATFAEAEGGKLGDGEGI